MLHPAWPIISCYHSLIIALRHTSHMGSMYSTLSHVNKPCTCLNTSPWLRCIIIARIKYHVESMTQSTQAISTCHYIVVTSWHFTLALFTGKQKTSRHITQNLKSNWVSVIGNEKRHARVIQRTVTLVPKPKRTRIDNWIMCAHVIYFVLVQSMVEMGGVSHWRGG